MPLQGIDFFGNLPFSPLDPTGTDSRTISDDQHRNIIASLNRQAPNWTGVINATHEDINTLIGLAANGTKPMPGVGGLTVLFFYNVNTPPPGWSLLTPDANIRQLVVGDAADGGTIGGTDNPVDETHPLSVSLTNTALSVNSGSTGNESGHTHPGGVHRHQWYRHLGGLNANHGSWNAGGTPLDFTVEAAGSGASLRTPANENRLSQDFHTSNGSAQTGGGSAHSHGAGNLSGSLNNGASTGTLQITPRYASGILGTLDA